MEKLIERWKSISSNLRIVISVATIAVIGFILVFMLNKPAPYEVLYSGLSETDMSAVEDYLSTEKIDYTVAESGTISVPTGNKSLIRMNVAKEGFLQSDNAGFSLFDESSIGATQEDKAVKYQRALKGQIERDLIMAFSDIEKATVQIPKTEKQSIFEDNRVDLKATVALKTKNGVKLSEEQVRTIQNFVSGPVLRLNPENVKVSDSEGRLLSEFHEDDSSKSLTKQSEILAQTKQRIYNDLMNYLSTVYGYENVAVTVNAKIDFDEIVRNTEKYGDGSLVSNQKRNEKTRKVDNPENQEPGTDNNGEVPNYEIEEIEGDTVYLQDKEEIIENFEVDKTVETIKEHPELTNVNVLVKVNEDLNQDEVQNLQIDMAVAAGLTGDGENGKYNNGWVRVSDGAFAQDTKVDPIKDVKEVKEIPLHVEYRMLILLASAVLLLLVAIIFFVIRRRNKKRLESMKEEEELQEEEAQSSIEFDLEEEDEEVENSGNSQEMLNALQSSQEKLEIERLTEKQRSLQEAANEAAKSNPKQTAEYLKRLLNER